MKKIFTLLTCLGLITMTFAQRLLTEDFNYPVGQLTAAAAGANVSGGAWISSSGTGNYIQVAAGSLTYPNYFTNPSGTNNGKVVLNAILTSAEDAYTPLSAAQTAGTVYVSFLLNVRDLINLAENTNLGGEFFAGFLSSTSTSTYNVGRIYIRKGATANTFNLGISATTPSQLPAGVSYAPTDYAVGTTHLVTIAFTIVPGALNDNARLFVDAPISVTEPTPDATTTFVGSTGIEPADVARFFLRQGSTSSTLGPTTPNADIDAVKVSTIYSDAILPLTLTSFKARLVDKNVQLSWNTSNEENVNSYSIQRSNDGRSFSVIGQLNAQNINQANYLFSDNAPLQGIGYYRLKITDNDGSSRLSAIVSINSRKKISADVFPNPVIDNINVSHTKAGIGASIIIYNNAGQQVKSIKVQPGATQSSFLVNELEKGSYVLAYDNDSESTVTKFIKK